MLTSANQSYAIAPPAGRQISALAAHIRSGGPDIATRDGADWQLAVKHSKLCRECGVETGFGGPFAMVARVYTVAFEGVTARPVDVQVQISPGLPAFSIVGLPD
ncbi:MAG TPA: hypothetical protein DCO73_09260, partial [Alphaproteobacteria bacterium]|nr:hypothetical protein [Alphaproteobacteria bacterium]